MGKPRWPPQLSSSQCCLSKLVGHSLPFSCWIDGDAFLAQPLGQYHALFQLPSEFRRQRDSSFFVNLILILTVEHVISPGSPQLSPVLPRLACLSHSHPPLFPTFPHNRIINPMFILSIPFGDFSVIFEQFLSCRLKMEVALDTSREDTVLPDSQSLEFLKTLFYGRPHGKIWALVISVEGFAA